MSNVKGIKDVQEENDDEKRQAYWNGSGQPNGGGSGQQVLDPTEFMKRARDEMGAQTADEWRSAQPGPASSSFTGAGQSLSGQSVEGAPLPAAPNQPHTITFYQNGFTVDDGPLRSVEDPENAAFLEAVNRGQMPAELAGDDGEAEGEVHLVEANTEKYTPPPVTLKPFSGDGRSLRDESAAGAPPPPEAAAAELQLDESAPMTTLQARAHPAAATALRRARSPHTTPSPPRRSGVTGAPRRRLAESGEGQPHAHGPAAPRAHRNTHSRRGAIQPEGRLSAQTPHRRGTCHPHRPIPTPLTPVTPHALSPRVTERLLRPSPPPFPTPRPTWRRARLWRRRGSSPKQSCSPWPDQAPIDLRHTS